MGSHGADTREAAKCAKTDAKKCGQGSPQMDTDGKRVSRGMGGPPMSPRSSSTVEITKTTEATKSTERKIKDNAR
ncbi:MAG: hypothetical protein JWP03_136 [Phycisphaerales bacterium]|nr:hypothetical protein [Phycisphaerales bacterium]